MLAILLRVAAALALASIVTTAAASPAVDVFGRAQASGAFAVTDGVANPPHHTAKPAVALPEPLRKVLFAALVWQGRLNARMEEAAGRLRRRDPPASEWLTLLLMSFSYGVLHAAGPGHGKLVIGTWLSSRNARGVQALILSGWTAAVQALSAIVLVIGAVWLGRVGVGSVLAQAESLEIVSYALLCLAGGWTLWTSLTRRDCCFDPTAVELVPRSGARSVADAARAGSLSLGASSYLGAKLSARNRSARRGGPSRLMEAATQSRSPWVQLLAMGLAAGVRPCTGAIFVLVASVGVGVPSIGIAATFAMATGVALTVTLVGLGSVGANRLLVARSLRYRSRVRNAQRVVAIAGGLLIVLFALSQLTLLLGGYVAPSLT